MTKEEIKKELEQKYIFKIECILEELNGENYDMLKLGLNNRVGDNERFLARIEEKLLSKVYVQKFMWKEYLEKIRCKK